MIFVIISNNIFEGGIHDIIQSSTVSGKIGKKSGRYIGIAQSITGDIPEGKPEENDEKIMKGTLKES